MIQVQSTDELVLAYYSSSVWLRMAMLKFHQGSKNLDAHIYILFSKEALQNEIPFHNCLFIRKLNWGRPEALLRSAH